MRELTLNEMEEVGGGIPDWLYTLGGSAACLTAAACFIPGAALSTVLGGVGLAIGGIIAVGYGVYRAGEELCGIISDNRDAILLWLVNNIGILPC